MRQDPLPCTQASTPLPPPLLTAFLYDPSSRFLLDETVGDTNGVRLAAKAVSQVVKIIMVTVCAAIGLRIQLRVLTASWRPVLVEFAAWLGITLTALVMLLLSSQLRVDNGDLRYPAAAGAGLLMAGIAGLGYLLWCYMHRSKPLSSEQMPDYRTISGGA